MNQNIEEKFNTIMPESDDTAICIMVEKPISKEGYEMNFLPRLNAMLEKSGEIRILVYYRDYKGWEPEAALNDMKATLEFGKKLKKLALVNPPEKEIFQRKIKAPLIDGEFKLFNESELQDALQWVKS